MFCLTTVFDCCPKVGSVFSCRFASFTTYSEMPLKCRGSGGAQIEGLVLALVVPADCMLATTVRSR